MDQQIKQQIETLIKSSKVFLFMKGTPQQPRCGFSAQIVQILQDNNIPFKSFNILENESMRQGIKDYAHWPTIPQLYINGKFVGGGDIVTEMAQSNELQRLVI